jgi:cytochrome c-type biogenesis protein CcmH
MMNPALLFLLVVVGMTAIVLWTVLRPLLAKRVDAADAASSAAQTNVDALRIELSEARRDHKLGLLSDASLAEAERELEARVLTESQHALSPATPRYKGTAISLGVLLPVLAVAGYAAVGSPAAVVPEVVRPAATQSATPSAASESAADQQMNELFRLAEERLSKEPNDLKGWLLLARAKASVGLFEGAMQAYEKAAQLDPKDSEIWSDYADAAAGQSQGKMDGKPLELINKSLALDGKNVKALLLRGTWEIQKNELAAAEKSFTLAKSLSEPNSGFAQIADNALAEIKTRQGGLAGAAASNTGAAATAGNSASGAAPAASDAALATVQLTLSAEARKAAVSGSSVFLIVRAAGADRGPPLAARKFTLAELEKPITLTAADAMIGGAGLKAGTDVTLQARLSLAGQPIAQAGDWQSAKLNAKLPAGQLQLAIDQAVRN